jgi:hypothetical protein
MLLPSEGIKMSRSKPVLALQPVRILLPTLLLLCGALLYTAMAAADAAYDSDPPGRVARVNLLDGHGSLQLAGSDSWVDDLVNRPLTGGDKLWIESGARAEVHVGSAVLRLGASTALQFVTIDDRTVRLRLTAGSLSVRLRQLDTDEVFNIETPAGDIELMEPGGYRLDVADRDERARVAVWSGRARVQGVGGMQVLRSNESAEIFGGDQPGIELASAGATDSLDLWAEDRDRREDESRSARYVSRDVVGYEELDGYGDWVVDPLYGSVWVPQHLAIDWAPYRFGYWSWVGPWGWTWIDDAPWGFAPCHYGRWVHRREGWGWAPGPVHGHRPIFAPALVAWVGPRPGRYTDPRHAPRVGWVPLGYNEVYRPPYHASRNYLQNANASNTHLERGVLARALDQERDEDTHDGQRGQHRYAHQDVPGAVTTVSRDTFVSARPVGRNRLKPDADELRGATLRTGAIDIKPGEHSYGRELPRDRPVSRPDRAIFERPVRSSNPATPTRALPARPQQPLQQRRVEIAEPAARAGDRSGANAGERPVERSPRNPPVQQPVSRPQGPPATQREPPPVYRESRPPAREAAPVREIPPVRQVPQVRELPPVREMPPARESPPVNAPPPRPIMVNPRPTYTPPAPPRQSSPPPPPAASPAPNVHPDHGERADRDRYHN